MPSLRRLRLFPLLSLLFLAWSASCPAQPGNPDESNRPPTFYLPPETSPPSSTSTSRVTSTLVVVFFPPTPPALVFPTRTNSPLSTPSVFTAPAELSAFVSEIFYPQLASQVQQEVLSGRQRENLRKYHVEKRALQQELRALLTRVLALEPSARTAPLAALARTQDPQIARLEARAEEFRHDLYRPEYSWSDRRGWHLGDDGPTSDPAVEIALVAQDFAFNQDGLSLAQRSLLREITFELINAPAPVQVRLSPAQEAELAKLTPEKQVAVRQALAGRAASASGSALGSGLIFLSPNLARLRLPENLSASPQAKVTDFLQRKAALRQELIDVVRREDATKPSRARTQRWEALAAAQAPAFAALETLAEDIRRELAPIPPPASRPPVFPLPTELIQRMISLFERAHPFESDLLPKVSAVTRKYPRLGIRTEVTPESLEYSFPSDSDPVSSDRRKADSELAALNRAYQATVAPLNQERVALRAAIAATLPSHDPGDVDLALSEAERLSLDQRFTPAVTAYHLATFEPGLSPVQRRILFEGAIEALTPPLPRGDTQPSTRRPNLRQIQYMMR